MTFGTNSHAAILRDATTLDDYDVKAETTYTYQVRAVNAGGGGAASAEDSATTGAAMTVKIEVAEPEVFEDQGPVRVVVVAEMPATGPNREKYELGFRVSVGTRSVTATSSDYDVFSDRPVFAPGDFRMESGSWVAEKRYTVALDDDDLFEPDETFRAEVRDHDDSHPFVTFPGATDGVTVTILNDDHKPVVPTQPVRSAAGGDRRRPAAGEGRGRGHPDLDADRRRRPEPVHAEHGGAAEPEDAAHVAGESGDDNDDGFYELTVQVSDGHHTPATSGDITVRLIDVAEPPRRPGAPWVRALDAAPTPWT